MDRRQLTDRLQVMAEEMSRLVQLAGSRVQARRRRGGHAGTPRDIDLSDVNLELLSSLASHSLTALKNAILYEETRQQVVADELTGLYNFRYFQRRLLEEWKRAHRHKLPMGLVIADLDRFKHVNDFHGHATGNAVLAAVSESIQRSVRDIDVVTRYGGEEFALILPQTPRAGVALVAERVRKSVEAVTVRSKKGRRVQVTISLGYDCWPGKARGPMALVERADRALYQAKRDGRNRVAAA